MSATAAAWRSFRGCEATAPLKHRIPQRGHGEDEAFRGCEATAPLKPTVGGSGKHAGVTFRGCEATAPLKQAPQQNPWVKKGLESGPSTGITGAPLG